MNEMARPTTLLNFISPEVNALYDGLRKKLLTNGILAPATRELIIFRFMMDAVNTLGSLYKDDEGELMTSLQMAKKISGTTDHKGVKNAAVTLLKNHLNIARSKEFYDYISDPDNLESFQNNIGLGSTGESTSSRRIGKEKELKDVTGLGISASEKQFSGIKEIVNAMNKVMSSRKTSKSRLGDKSKYAGEMGGTEGSGGYNLNIEFADLVLDAIDLLMDDDGMLKSIDTAITDLEFLESFYKKTVVEGTGSTKEEFDNFMGKLKAMKGMTPQRAKIFDLLAAEVDSLSSDSGIDKFVDVSTTNISPYDDYDRDVLSKFLDTPEKKSAFEEWYYTNQKWREAKNKKLEELWYRRMENVAFSNPKFANAVQGKELFVNNTINQWLLHLAKLDKERKETSDPKRLEFIANKIAAITKDLESYKASMQSEEQEESGVMKYMTEQVKKDSHTKQPDVFVDRGFKKPKNYWHWLEINK